MPVFSVDHERCHRDGVCAAVCPSMAIKWRQNELPQMRKNGESNCIGCGQCVLYCPHGACSLEGFPKQQPINKDSLATPEAAEMLLKTRRSIRQYKNKPVPNEVINKILDAARFAPSAVNKQPVRWFVISGKDKLREIGDIAAEGLKKFAKENSGNPFASKARLIASSWQRGGDPFFREAPHLVGAIVPNQEEWLWGPTDGVIAMTYAEIAATSLGVGTCWAGYFIRTAQLHRPLSEYLGVKEHEEIVAAQVLGFSKFRGRSIPVRKEPEVLWL